jgi:hypothetical protein
METKGYLILLGLLAFACALIGFGTHWRYAWYGIVMIVAGAIIGLYWLFCLVLPIMGAMNSDV